MTSLSALTVPPSIRSPVIVTPTNFPVTLVSPITRSLIMPDVA